MTKHTSGKLPDESKLKAHLSDSLKEGVSDVILANTGLKQLVEGIKK